MFGRLLVLITKAGKLRGLAVTSASLAACARTADDGRIRRDMQQRLAAIGVDVKASSPDELAAFQRAELAKWGKIIKDSGAKVD